MIADEKDGQNFTVVLTNRRGSQKWRSWVIMNSLHAVHASLFAAAYTVLWTAANREACTACFSVCAARCNRCMISTQPL